MVHCQPCWREGCAGRYLIAFRTPLPEAILLFEDYRAGEIGSIGFCGRRQCMRRCMQPFWGTIPPRPALLSVENGDHDDEIRSAGAAGQPEPQGPRQRAKRSPRYHQGPSPRREEQHPRTGRARQSDAEHEQSPVGVRAGAAFSMSYLRTQGPIPRVADAFRKFQTAITRKGDQNSRMGGAKRYPSLLGSRSRMGFAALYPSCKKTCLRISRRDAPEGMRFAMPSITKRAQGKPGALSTRDRAHKMHTGDRKVRRNTRPSLRNGFNSL
jgi:hypothetical protein